MDGVPFFFVENVVENYKNNCRDLVSCKAVRGYFGRFANLLFTEKFYFVVNLMPRVGKAFVQLSGKHSDGAAKLEYAENNAQFLEKLVIDVESSARHMEEIQLDDKLFWRLKKLAVRARTTQLRFQGDSARISPNICSCLKRLSMFVDELQNSVYSESEGFVDLISSILNCDRLRSFELKTEIEHEKYRTELLKAFFKPSFEVLEMKIDHSETTSAILDAWLRKEDRLERKFIYSSGKPEFFENANLASGLKREDRFRWVEYNYPESIGDLAISKWIRQQVSESINHEYKHTARFYRLPHTRIPNHFACLTFVIEMNDEADYPLTASGAKHFDDAGFARQSDSFFLFFS